jgi:hypothetical protein
MHFGKTKGESMMVRLHEKTKEKPGRKNRVPGGASSGRADRKAEAETCVVGKKGISRLGLTDATKQGNESLAAAALVRDGRKPRERKTRLTAREETLVFASWNSNKTNGGANPRAE